MSFEIDFDKDFAPLYGATIKLPANSIMWRGYDPAYPAISDRPAYFGAKRFAQSYAEKYGTDAKPFINSSKLNLLDVRFMKVLLSQLFENNERKPSDQEMIVATTISFGLSSLYNQIKLFRHRYKVLLESTDPALNALKQGFNNLVKSYKDTYYEQQGVRVAETSNDALVMGFLKTIFGPHYDGYISPSIMSPFHVEKSNFILNSEIVIFNPIYSGIKLAGSIPMPINKTTISNIILYTAGTIETIDIRNMKTSYFKGGGAGTGGGAGNADSVSVCNDYNHEIDKGNKDILKLYKKGEACGKRWINKPVKLHNFVSPGPQVPINDFFQFNNEPFISKRRDIEDW